MLLAEMVRLEAALFGAMLGLLVAQRSLVRRRLGAAPAIAAGLLALALLPPALRSGAHAMAALQDPATGAMRQDWAAGRALRARLARGGGAVLIDSADSLDFLDVLVFAGALSRFRLTHGDDPVAAAVDLPLRHGAPPEDCCLLARDGGAALAAAGATGWLLLREAALRAPVEAAGAWTPMQCFGPWVLYAPAATP